MVPGCYRELLTEREYHTIEWAVWHVQQRCQHLTPAISHEDLWQSALLAWWKTREKQNSLRYLKMVVLAALYDLLRSQGRASQRGKTLHAGRVEQPVSELPELPAPTRPDLVADLVTINEALAVETPRNRNIFRALYWDDKARDQVASDYHLSRAQLHNICARIKARCAA